MRIALIRHGCTAWNAQGRVQGSTETELSEEGRSEMARLRPPAPFDTATAFVSPQLRARQTAGLLGLKATEDVRLREQHWGVWEGLTRREMAIRFGEDCFEKAGRGTAFRPPGGEACFEQMARVKDFLQETAQKCELAVAVAHMGVLRVAFALATGWDMTGVPMGLDLKAALVLEIRSAEILPQVQCLPLVPHA